MGLYRNGLTGPDFEKPIHAQSKVLTGFDSLTHFNMTEMMMANSFMIVREPFERLVSAYEVCSILCKFSKKLKPGFFWNCFRGKESWEEFYFEASLEVIGLSQLFWKISP